MFFRTQVIALFAMLGTVSGCQSAPQEPIIPGGVVVTEDAERFWAVYAEMSSDDEQCKALELYFERATPGLLQYTEQFNVGRSELCEAMRTRPERYATIPQTLLIIDSLRSHMEATLDSLSMMLPEASWPTVYFLVGNGISAGSTFGGRNPQILIGTERLSDPSRIPRLIAHEAIHTQQRYPRRILPFIPETLLRVSIKEGAADFLADLALAREPSGEVHAFGSAHEEEIWAAFELDAGHRRYERWIYNGWNRDELGDWPPDLGYFVGYRIAQAYYERAVDKHQAVRDILTIQDFEGFLRNSGYPERFSGRASQGAAGG